MKFDEVVKILESFAGVACPGYAFEARKNGEVLIRVCGGFSACVGGGQRAPVDEATVFDLASLTKPLSTALLAAILCDRGIIGLHSTIRDFFGADDDWLSRFDGRPGSRYVPDVSALLGHRAGLVPWLPFAGHLSGRLGISAAGSAQAASGVLEMAIDSMPRNPSDNIVYSDVGYILLGMMLSRVSGQGIAELFMDLVANEIGLDSTAFMPIFPVAGPVLSDSRFAATAWCGMRGRILQGEVHDDNAWFLGGAAGHAGLFSTISQTASLVDEWIMAIRGESRILGRETARQFVFQDFGPPEARRTHGLDRPAAVCSSAGDLAPAGTVGHLGFTGTSFWFDRDSGVSVVLLTNRVNPDMHGRKDEIKAMRRAVYDAAWKALA